MEASLTFLPLHSDVTMTTETPRTPQYGDNTNYLVTTRPLACSVSHHAEGKLTSTSSQLP